jgi:uncharacterized protein YdiU (UPF0061 family)
MNFSNSYVRLGDAFYEKIMPVPVRDPKLLLWNARLAEQLMIPDELGQNSAALARFFSGNDLLPGSEPIATVYAGHQFGSFVPRLGDGRAHLLGEVLDPSGQRWDIQLKGSGRTSFSRGGDGRCPLGPAVREFLMSEAMQYLGVPTTRSLAVTTTGESVFRDRPVPGGVVTRVASSHLRIGTFQYFAAQGDHRALKTIFDYSVDRHYPELRQRDGNPYVLFLQQVMERQIHLVVEWMRVGFIHGVMNTDNTTISGETIDYGPCAMLGVYDPQTVYSSIDRMGRYAFGRQPEILRWNLVRLAESLLPLMGPDANGAVDALAPVIDAFPERFETEYLKMMGEKLGLQSVHPEDRDLIEAVLKRLEDKRLDYTVTFHLLTQSLTSETTASQMKEDLGECFVPWRKRLNSQTAASEEIQQRMRQRNPAVIPRNHHVEAVIKACVETGEASSAEAFLKALRSPYEELAQTSRYQDPPADDDKGYQTFCGT